MEKQTTKKTFCILLEEYLYSLSFWFSIIGYVEFFRLDKKQVNLKRKLK